MPKAKSGPVAVFDFTLPSEGITPAAIIQGLTGLCKKYAFQEEKSDSGYLHYQGRVSLIKKRREGVARSSFKREPCFKKIHLSITSTNGMGDMFYVTKDDTRINGPWTDKDEKPEYVPRHIRECKELRPFQAEILRMAHVYDPRKIDVIYCPEGNKGKSTLIGKACAAGHGVMPPCFDYKDILRMVYGMPTSKAYFVDMPRAMPQDKMAGFFSGLETMKDGRAYDDRYKFKQRFFDSPRIFLFTNRMPDLRHLSKDRWVLWTISPEFELVSHVPVVPVV